LRNLLHGKAAFGGAASAGHNRLFAFRKVELGRLAGRGIASLRKQRANLSKKFRAMFEQKQSGVAKEAAVAIESDTPEEFPDTRIADAGIAAGTAGRLAALARGHASVKVGFTHLDATVDVF
jgi:hypothetical protein